MLSSFGKRGQFAARKRWFATESKEPVVHPPPPPLRTLDYVRWVVIGGSILLLSWVASWPENDYNILFENKPEPDESRPNKK